MQVAIVLLLRPSSHWGTLLTACAWSYKQKQSVQCNCSVGALLALVRIESLSPMLKRTFDVSNEKSVAVQWPLLLGSRTAGAPALATALVLPATALAPRSTAALLAPAAAVAGAAHDCSEDALHWKVS